MQTDEKFLQRRIVYYRDVAEQSFNCWQLSNQVNKKLGLIIVDLLDKLDKGGLICEEDVEDVLELLDEDAIKKYHTLHL